jgi:2-polyprenyl-6-methoxyphenol hydroxylase-like FAD-dependent oxidoreductase
MVYRSLDDPWLKGFRENPEAALKSVMPRLKTLIGGFRVEGPVKMRPADLYSTQNTERAGIVLVGDAFGTSCPAAGTGASKVFTDVERLCNHHIPGWLSTDGMGEEKIAQFYADPVKQACDEASLQKAYRLRELCMSEALNWRARRAARFLIHRGMNTLRQARATLGRKHEAVGTPEAGISA